MQVVGKMNTYFTSVSGWFIFKLLHALGLMSTAHLYITEHKHIPNPKNRYNKKNNGSDEITLISQD